VLPQKTAPTFSFRLMPNSCSRRSESSYFIVDALNFILIMSLYLTSFFASIIFPSIACSTACVREPTFQPGTCMINVWTFNLYDGLALRGVTYDHNSCMMKQESWFLHKLYNENFLSDGYCVTHKSGVQDASRRACLEAKQCIWSIHPKGRF
jgi:hypothetical protein